jgi:hypothetical protein
MDPSQPLEEATARFPPAGRFLFRRFPEPIPIATPRCFAIHSAFQGDDLVNQILRIPAALTLFILFAVGLSSCGQETSTAATINSAPMSEVDRMINEYEKTVNEFVRVAKKHKTGDVSITVKLITGEQIIRQEATRLQQESARMTPAQTQRVASISAKTAPFLK